MEFPIRKEAAFSGECRLLTALMGFQCCEPVEPSSSKLEGSPLREAAHGAEGRMATVKPALNGKSVETGTHTDHTSGRKGLVFGRRFTDGRTSAFDMVEWEKRTALIGNEKGATIFRQEGVEV